MPDLGMLLRQYRAQRGLSQQRLAHLAGLDHSFVSRLERGERLPSRAVVLRLARVLGLPPHDRDALLLAAGYAPPSLDDLDPVLVRAAMLLGNGALSPDEKAALRDAIQSAVRLAECGLASRSRKGGTHVGSATR